MKIFSKTIDYNLILEQVLDSKRLSESSESLLLSMLYKIETSYDDYKKVKRLPVTKSRFLNNIIETINEYIEIVKIVEPFSEESEILEKNDVIAVTNDSERLVLSYPTETSILYAISDIEPKYFYIKDYIFKNEFQELLVEGSNFNIVEVIENFNGWSWNSKNTLDKGYVSNIIYQNLLIMFGYEFMERCKNSSSNDFDIIKYLKSYNIQFYYNLTEVLYLKNKNKDLDTEIKKKIAQLKRKIKKIEISENKTDLQNSRKLKIYNNELEVYKNLILTDKTLEQSVLELQKRFIKILLMKSKQIKTREDFIDIIYQIRYYRNIYICKEKAIKDYPEFENALNKILKNIITLGTKNAFIKMISYDVNLNSNILINCLDSNSIELDKIKLKLNVLDNIIVGEVFENDVFEKKFEIHQNSEKLELTIKKGKKNKIFT